MPASSVAGAGLNAPPPERRLTVLFDGECPFCRWTVRQLSLLDRARRLEFLPLQGVAERPDRPELIALAGSRPLRRALHVVRRDGRVESGGRAILEILSLLPGGFFFRRWGLLPGFAAALDLAYRWVAGHRRELARALRLD